MEGTKTLLESKTFWGAALAGLAAILKLYHFDFLPADQAAAVDSVMTLIGVGGSLYAIYGRIVATKVILPPSPPKAS